MRIILPNIHVAETYLLVLCTYDASILTFDGKLHVSSIYTCSLSLQSDVDVVAVLGGSQHLASVDTVVFVGWVDHYGPNVMVLHR